MKTAHCIFASLCLAAALPCLAEPLAWDDCIRIAAEANPEIQAARSTYKSSQLLERAEKGAYLPQLSANAGAGYGDIRGESRDVGGSFPASSGDRQGSDNSASLSLSQSLFSGFEIDANVKRAAAAAEASGISLETAKAKVSYDLRTAAANLVYSQEYIKLSENIIQRREENLKLVELRFEGGMENKGSLMLSKASLSDAKVDRLQAQNSTGLSKVQLAKVLGRADGSDVAFVGPIPVSPPTPPADFKMLLPDTFERRQALAQKRSAEAQVEAARAQLYPKLNLTGDMALQRGSLSSEMDRATVGLTLALPLFAGGRDYNTYNSARAGLAAAQTSVANVEQQLLVKLKQTFNAFIEAVERERVAREYVEAARVRAEIARNKYNNGLLSFENWDIIENDLINRQKSGLLSRRDRITAEAAWEQALGRGVIP